MRNYGTPNENDTCVIELCSLAAKNLKVKKNVEFDPNSFLEERIKVIRRKIDEFRPRLAAMYGLSHQKHWQAIADGHHLHPDQPVKIDQTWMVLTPHPVSRGRRNSAWLQLADKLRVRGVRRPR